MSLASAHAMAIFPLVIIVLLLSLVKLSLRALSSVSARRLAEEVASPRSRRILESYLADPTEAILHLQSLIQMGMVTIAALATMVVVERGLPHPTAIAIAVCVAFAVVFEHFAPRFTMSVDAERMLVRLLPAYVLLDPFARTFARPLTLIFRKIFRERQESDDAEVSDEELRAFIDVGEKAGILEGDEGELLESLVDFGDTVAREVMTPRVDIVALEAGRTVAEAREILIKRRHSRLPVYRDRVDHIEGVVYIKDLLAAWRDGKESDRIEAWMKPTLFVPETKKVSSLLRDFQENRVNFAIVVDEFGGTSGLVTMEDLLEEIVGDIADEHEDPSQRVIAQEDGSYLLSAKVDVETLDELFDIELEEGDYGTVAGLVFATLGRVPKAGEEFDHGELHFEVLDVDRRRVNQVRVRRRAPAPDEGDAPISTEATVNRESP